MNKDVVQTTKSSAPLATIATVILASLKIAGPLAPVSWWLITVLIWAPLTIIASLLLCLTLVVGGLTLVDRLKRHKLLRRARNRLYDPNISATRKRTWL